ncbi:hypothetical protein GCM10009745_63550 [Kribbella yunnanensis]|uniref:Uncharacterized protein n=1 Tax=Kribbella yunnanensis TaxID=190194 RepID=A0ABN2IKP4_9ACTN
MVVIITVDKRLASNLWGRSGSDYSEAWRFSEVHRRVAQVAILIDEGDQTVRWLGRAVPGRRVSTRDRLLKIQELERIDPIPTSAIRQYWTDEVGRLSGEQDGMLTDAEGHQAVDALVAINPHLASIIQRLDRDDASLLGSGARGELRNQERDALGLVLTLANIDRAPLGDWNPPGGDIPFLAGMPGYVEREDALVDHDLHRFGDWAHNRQTRVGWQTFREGDRRVFVMNANRSAVEHSLGVDMVYYNETRDSFVLVQYKKMRPEMQKGGKRALRYRPDERLSAEVERMQRINEVCAAAGGEYRLNWGASWLKLCDPDPAIEDPTALIRGMYFALDHFRELLVTSRGPQGGIRIGYDTVDRHLSNTLFIDLVRDGWIGSRGPASDQIKAIIRESLASGRAVLFGVEPKRQ